MRKIASGEYSVTKRERLEARISAEQKELFQRAADLSGRSLTDFIVSSVQTAAVEAIQTYQILRLTDRETEAFLTAVDNPAPPNESLRKADRLHRAIAEV